MTKIQSGDIVTIQNGAAFWIAGERAITAVGRQRFCISVDIEKDRRRLDSRMLREAEMDLLFRFVFASGMELQHAGVPSIVIEDQGDFVVMRRKEAERRQSRKTKIFTIVDNFEMPVGKADLVEENLLKFLELRKKERATQ
jgi:hypothetical protein